MIDDAHVYTLTSNERQRLLDRCCRSVVKQWSPDKYSIIECPTRYALFSQRISCIDRHQFTTFVDDDDIVINDSINVCMNVIDRTRVGVVATNQLLCDIGLQVTRAESLTVQKLYENVVKTPQELHHLTVLNRDYLDKNWLLEQLPLVGSLFDWLLRISLSYVGGAVHVPIHGYI